MVLEQPIPPEMLTREQFEEILRRSGLHLPQAEYDNLYEGAVYIERLVGRLAAAQAEDHGKGGRIVAGDDNQGEGA